MNATGKYKKVFLITPFIKEDGTKPDFVKTRSQMYSGNVEVVIAQASIFDNYKNRHGKAMQTAVKEMMKCKEVVTCLDWHEHEECKKMVNIARLCQLEVTHALNYIKLHAND
mgnify:CR=1 FL=1